MTCFASDTNAFFTFFCVTTLFLKSYIRGSHEAKYINVCMVHEPEEIFTYLRFYRFEKEVKDSMHWFRVKRALMRIDEGFVGGLFIYTLLTHL